MEISEASKTQTDTKVQYKSREIERNYREEIDRKPNKLKELPKLYIEVIGNFLTQTKL